MKRAFSIVELIFVMVILGILASVAFYGFKPKNLQNDTDYLFMQLLKTRYQGINYDKRGLREGGAIGCISLKEAAIEKMAKSDHYAWRSSLHAPCETLCFDSLGRPHCDDNLTQFSSIAKSPLLITLLFHNKERNITILPQSGYAIIKY